MESWQSVLTTIVAIAAPLIGIFLYFKIFSGKNGERHMKMRIQGPFVPLSKEEIEEDNMRKQKNNDAHDISPSAPD